MLRTSCAQCGIPFTFVHLIHKCILCDDCEDAWAKKQAEIIKTLAFISRRKVGVFERTYSALVDI